MSSYVCGICNRKIVKGDEVWIESEDTVFPVCSECWKNYMAYDVDDIGG